MLKPGVRLKSAVCDAEVMVIRIGDADDVTCGGKPMHVDAPDARQEGEAEQMHGCLVGKRYVNQADTAEILCVKSGDGALHVSGEELMTKDTKKLPSSD